MEYDELTSTVTYKRGGLQYGKTYVITSCILNEAGNGKLINHCEFQRHNFLRPLGLSRCLLW